MEHIGIYNSFMNEKFSGNEFLIGLVTVWILSAASYILDFPGFARHQIALKSNSMRGVYEQQQTVHRRI